VELISLPRENGATHELFGAVSNAWREGYRCGRPELSPFSLGGGGPAIFPALSGGLR
jgi:hypothetical protein